MLTNDHKKALFVLGCGLLLFWFVKPKMNKIKADTKLNYTNDEADPKNRVKMSVPTMNLKAHKNNKLATNGFAALKAYIDAYNNGEPQSVLNDLNVEFGKEFGVKVNRRKSDNKLVVTDLEGKEILVNN
jgi:hypothetical protein